MALTSTDNELTGGVRLASSAIRSFFQRKQEQLLEARARRKVFRTTYSELAALSDRDLSDLGIPRCNIRRLALEAAHDC